MKITLVSEYSSFDVCTSTGYLLEMFSNIQQEGRSIRFNLEQQGFTMLPFTQPKPENIGSTLHYNNEQVVVVDDDEGPLYYYHETDGWFTCEELK